MDDTLFETQLGALQPSFAARVTGTIGAVDIGVGLFSGVSREARFVAQVTAPEVVAAHDLIQQASLDLRWSYEGLAVKLELMGRLWSRELRFFGAAGLGPEYTLSDLFGTDLTLVAEGFVDEQFQQHLALHTLFRRAQELVSVAPSRRQVQCFEQATEIGRAQCHLIFVLQARFTARQQPASGGPAEILRELARTGAGGRQYGDCDPDRR